MGKLTLPVNKNCFPTIREEKHHYVDKTGLIESLANGEKHNFLSRPPGFGKTLLVSTLEELFEGNEKLFRGLAIHDSWDWTATHPVIHLSLKGADYTLPEMTTNHMSYVLSQQERIFESFTECIDCGARLDNLIRKVKKDHGQKVVLLVDDCDLPVLCNLDNPDVARASMDALRDLYSVVKDRDDDIHFSFFTGVSGFTKGEPFSEVDNLFDITLDPKYSSLCGFTDAELDSVFKKELRKIDRGMLSEWYGGYCWLGSDKVYNPRYAVQALYHGSVPAIWIGPYHPRYLTETIRRKHFFSIDLHQPTLSGTLLQSFDDGQFSVEAILFHAGYLTVTSAEGEGSDIVYHLDYPNVEAKWNLHRDLLLNLVVAKHDNVSGMQSMLQEYLDDRDFDSIEHALEYCLSGIPYIMHADSKWNTYEAYFASVVYSLFLGARLSCRLQLAPNRSCIAITVEAKKTVYIFVFSIDRPVHNAATNDPQENNECYDHYKRSKKRIYRIDIVANPYYYGLDKFDVKRV